MSGRPIWARAGAREEHFQVPPDGQTLFALGTPPAPASVQAWINGLRATQLGPVASAQVELEAARPGDQVTIRYVPRGAS